MLISEVERDLLLKEERVAYWEKYHRIPSMAI